METGWLLPDLDDPTASEFWDGCARGELLVQACGVVRRVAHAAPADVPALPVDRGAVGADVGARPHLVVHRPAPAAAARVRARSRRTTRSSSSSTKTR